MIVKRWVLGIFASVAMAVGAMGVDGPVGAAVSDAEAAALSGGCFGLRAPVTCNGADGGCEAQTCVGSNGKSCDNSWKSTTLCGSGCGYVWVTTPNTCG